MEGRAVSAGEVFEKVSNRMVSFKMVDEIFKDMTASGGIFYNMQELQAETLKGKVSNLTDAYQVMLNKIGEGNEDQLKGGVDALRYMIENYEKILAVIKTLIITYGVYRTGLVLTNIITQKAAITNGIYDLSLIAMERSTKGVVAAQALARTSTTLLGRSLGMLVANPYLGWATIITGVVTATIILINQSNKLKKELDGIAEAGLRGAEQQERGFERLANKLKNASKGSNELKEAISEMNRTYGEYLPNLLTESNYLVEIEKNYKKVTDAIYNKAKATSLEKGYAKIEEEFGQDQIDIITKIRSKLAKNYNLSVNETSDIVKLFNEEIKKGAKDSGQALAKIFGDYFGKTSEIAKDISKEVVVYSEGRSSDIAATFTSLATSIREQKKAEEDLSNVSDIRFKRATASNKAIRDEIDKIEKKYEGLTDSTENATLKTKELADAYRRLGNEAKAKELEATIKIDPKIKQDIDNLVEDIKKKSKLESFTFIEFDKESSQEYFDKLNENVDDYDKKIKQLSTASKEVYILGDNKTNKESLEILREQRSVALDILEKYGARKEKGEIKERKAELESLKERLELIDKIVKKNAKLVKETGNLTYAANKTKEAYSDIFKKIMPKGFDISNLLTFDKKKVLNVIDDLSKSLKGKKAIELAMETKAELEIEYYIQLNTANLALAEKQLQDLFSGYDLSLDIESSGQFGSLLAGLFSFKPTDIVGLEQGVNKVLSGLESQVSEYQSKKTELQLTIDTATTEKNKNIAKQQLTELINQESDAAKLITKIRADLEKKKQEDYKRSLNEFEKLYSEYAEFPYRQVEIERQAAKEIENINKALAEKIITQQKALELKTAVETKRKQSSAKLTFEEFKSSDDYIAAFEDLDRASKTAINRVMEKMEELRNSSLENLSPTELREFTNAYKRLREEAEKRDIFGSMISGFKEYVGSFQEVRDANQSLIDSQAELNQATKERIEAEQKYVGSSENVLANGRAYAAALEKEDKAKKKVAKTTKDVENAEAKQTNAKKKFINATQAAESAVSNFASVLDQMVDILGLSKDSEAAAFMKDFSKSLGLVASGLGVVTAAVVLLEASMAPLLIVAGAVAAALSVVMFFAGAKNRKIDKEMAKSERAVKKLEWAYDDLGKAIDRALGDEKYKLQIKQLQNLSKQAAEVQRQAELERKRKNPDMDKIDELKRKYQELNQQIYESLLNMKNEMLGIDAAGLADNLANALKEAFKEGTNAAEAWGKSVDEIVNDMVYSMLVAKLLAPRIADELNKYWDSLMPKTAEATEKAKRVTQLDQQIADLESLKPSLVKDPFGYTEYLKKLALLQKEREDAIKQMQNANNVAEGEIPKATEEATNALKDGLDGIGKWFGDLVPDWLKESFNKQADEKLGTLQKGIQSITEQQATALESLFNSILYQSYIQSSLQTTMNVNIELVSINTSQMLLYSQQSYQLLQQMIAWQQSITFVGHKQGGNGLKVFID